MTTIAQISQFLERFAPTRLAEDWDNVGLLVGDPSGLAENVMTCLTVTPESASEAIRENVDLIVSHHPLPFRPLKRITTESVASKMLWDLIRAGVAIYSPHTGFDSAKTGINQSLGELLGIADLRPIASLPDDPESLGAGRIGKLAIPQSLAEFTSRVKSTFGLPTIQLVGEPEHPVTRVAIACGSGGSFLSKAQRLGCDTFVTGEATFHTALEAKANGIAMVLLGHYSSERFAVERLGDEIKKAFPALTVWPSVDECDPLSFV